MNKNKNWGGMREESKTIKNIHEEWAKKNGYRETSNERLNIENSERFVQDAQRKRPK